MACGHHFGVAQKPRAGCGATTKNSTPGNAYGIATTAARAANKSGTNRARGGPKMTPRDLEKDAVVIGRRYGFTRHADVMGAAWLAAREAEAKWRADGGAGRRTFFARRLRVELLRELPRRSLPLHLLTELPENDAGIAADEGDVAAECNMALAAERIAMLPSLERRLAEEVLAGATLRETAEKMQISLRRAQQLLVSAVDLLRARPDGGQGDFWWGEER